MMSVTGATYCADRMGPMTDICGTPEVYMVYKQSDVGRASHTASGLISMIQFSQTPLQRCRNRDGAVFSGL